VASTSRRKNSELLGWLRAALVALSTYGGLLGMQFSPTWGAAALGLAAGVLAAISVDLGVLAAVVALTLPLAAANPVVGALFAVLGIVGMRYLGSDGGSVFLLIAGAVAGAVLGPTWIVVPLAGYLLGAGEGALAAAVACLSVELLGVVLGATALTGGVAVHGPGKALVSFANAPESLFSLQWVAASVDSIGAKSVDRVVSVFADLGHPIVLLIQPLLWALGAAVASRLVARARARRNMPMLAASISLGVLIPAAGSAVLASTLQASIPMGPIAIAAISSVALAVAFALLLELAFPLERVVQAEKPRPATMSMEDADVDELLRLVATAEDRLASQHTTHKVVMITDMKAFSKMTEEDGSILSAKTIQKHRDLLLPVIERHGGHGKSTGGDGLVAAFDDAPSALSATAEMLRALEQYNASHPSERELAIRVGVAEGEVVLDKGGRPFIGTALNLAARVMNLADGGQAYVTAQVAAKAPSSVPVYSHGSFRLKNIAEPVVVAEVLWAEEQTPRGPSSGASASE
jgi:class 3 adenylate cyclase